jgi:hypothetical protein
MPLPECSVLWPTNRAEKGIDAVEKTAIDAKIVDLTEVAQQQPFDAKLATTEAHNLQRRPGPRRARRPRQVSWSGSAERK